MRLIALCPHSWKETQDNMRYEQGEEHGDNASLMLVDGGYLLTWNRGTIQVTVSTDPVTNLPSIPMVQSFKGFKAYAAAFSSFPTVIPDNDDESVDNAMDINIDSRDDASIDEPYPSHTRVHFDTKKNVHEPPVNIDDPLTHRDNALFLSWHIKLGHAPFNLIRWAAMLGLLSKKLQKCQNTVCPACLYGKQKCRPWQTKATPDTKIKKTTFPGQCVSVDQLISRTPGLVAQTTGCLTTAHYQVATIFVDHYSDLDYVHVQESTSVDKTIEAKRAFERFAHHRGVTIRHYHADNSIFASNGFWQEVESCGQSISFCGVRAHHQNGVAERRIQDLT